MLYSTPAGGVAAVYTMSNTAPMNQILIMRLNASGHTGMVSRINTNGTGVNFTTPNALYSQGAVTVYSNYLFVVNAGSNSLSMFWINPADATQLRLLSVQPTFGTYPVSVAVNGMYACVLTGGTITGIRCFTYNSSGLYMMSTFDRNLTSYLSQSLPPVGPPNTMSQISFSADNRALIVAVKGSDATKPGYLLFLFLTNSGTILSDPLKKTLTGSGLPFSITLVESNGLLLSDAEPNSVSTLIFSSTTGEINNHVVTLVDSDAAPILCWSTYSPTIGNYYIIGGTGNIVEVSVNLSSIANPVKIIQYFLVPRTNGGLDGTVVTLAGKDYLYVIGLSAHVTNGFRLNAAGNATLITSIIVEQVDTSTIPKLIGIAGFVQTKASPPPPPSSSSPLFISSITIMISMLLIYFGREF